MSTYVDSEVQKLVEEVMESYLERLKEKCVEQLLVLLPGIVGHLVRSTAETEKAVRGFYAAHPEFAEKKDVVARLVEKHDAVSPGRTLDKVLEDVTAEMKALEVRTKTFSDISNGSL